MKKFIISLLTLTILLSTNYTPILAVNKNIDIKINGELLDFDVDPIIENNRVLVPIRKISQTLGYDVDWIQESNEIIINRDDIVIKFRINDKNAFVNNKLFTFDTPPKIINNRTLVPIRFVCELLDLDIDWDNQNYTVVIKNNYEEVYLALNKTLKYKGEFNMKMVMNTDIEDEPKILLNFNINGLSDTVNSHIKGILSIIKEDSNTQIPYEIINLDNKTYMKYSDEWKEGNPSEDEQFFNINHNIVNSINNNFINNFESLLITQLESTNYINSRIYLLDFDENKSNSSNSENTTINNYKAEIYINDKSEITKEIISYTTHGMKNNKKLDTLVIIDINFENLEKEINISSPIN